MGVEVLTCYDDSEEEEDDDENNNQKLRYEKPNVEEVVKENLQRMTSSEVDTIPTRNGRELGEIWVSKVGTNF